MISWTPTQAFAEIARGDKDAEAFISALYIYFHKADDAYDKDKPVSAADYAGIDLQTFCAFASNPFFQKHQAFLLPVLTLGALAWVASEDRAKSPEILDRLESQVLKSQYSDVFFATAYLVGGWSWAVEMGRKYRQYHFDNEGVKI